MTKRVIWSDLQVPPINLYNMPKQILNQYGFAPVKAEGGLDLSDVALEEAVNAINNMINEHDIKDMADQQNIDLTLTERGNRYGSFKSHATIAQNLKNNMWVTTGWSGLAPDMRQALEVIQDKVARILNGDPTYLDNWHDIQGYAKLVEDRLKNENEKGLFG